MVICKQCQVRMQKEKSGLKIALENDYCQHGDLYRCPLCGIEVLSDLGEPHLDPEPNNNIYLELRYVEIRRGR